MRSDLALTPGGGIRQIHGSLASMTKPPVPFTATATVPRTESSSVRTASYVLLVADGPDQGGRFVLDGTAPSRVLVGTGPACDIRLTDRLVSRRHAALDPVGARLRVTDLDSTNRTFINGIEISEAFLDGGEFVRVGGTTFHVQQTETSKAAELSTRTSFGNVVGGSEEMRRLYPLCERIAKSDVPVIIEGETGTGKEVLAESLHAMGLRSKEPFVVFDCTATPPNLLESALFGHEKGAFTGATGSRAGVFEQAHRGTLLIDEIGDLDINLQPKLLRVIQRMEVQRVGASRPIRVDVRVIAATRRDLDREVQAGRFRDDLFYRLAVARIELPPLRRRTGDIELLTRHFWATGGGAHVPIEQNLLHRFGDYAWPGNVRELRNAVMRRLALGDLADIDPRAHGADFEEDLGVESKGGPEFIETVVNKLMPLAEARQEVVQEFERRYVDHVLEVHGGNVTRAATTAGVARRYFHLLRAKYADKDDEA